ncbi:MAG: hypothetical protein ABII22_03405 [Candidatus Micrarchaeota archaeon]
MGRGKIRCSVGHNSGSHTSGYGPTPKEFIDTLNSNPSILRQPVPESILSSRELLVHLFDRLSARNPAAPSHLIGCDADVWDAHGLVSGLHNAMDGFAYQLATSAPAFFKGSVLNLNTTTCVFLSQLYAAFNRHHPFFSENPLLFWINSLSDNMSCLAQQRLHRDIPENVFQTIRFTAYDPVEMPVDLHGKFDVVVVSNLSLIRGDALSFLMGAKELIQPGKYLLLLTFKPLEQQNQLIPYSNIEIDETTRLLYGLLSKPIPDDLFSKLVNNGFDLLAYHDSYIPSGNVFCTFYQKNL